MVDPAAAESQELLPRFKSAEVPAPRLTEQSYRELMAVLEMEDTGRSRRGSL